jgi:ADP-ribose pyrophosphatase
MSTKPWKRIEPTTVTRVGWRTITSKTFIMASGKKTVFDTLHADGQEFAGVLALTPENKVVVVRNFQSGPEKMMEDLPGGFVDAGEDPEVAMRRELLEETGYQAGSVKYLGKFHKDAYMNAAWHAFMAYDCVKIKDQELEEEEELEVTLISISQLIDNAKNDRLQDHAVVLMAYDELRRIKEENQ